MGRLPTLSHVIDESIGSLWKIAVTMMHHPSPFQDYEHISSEVNSDFGPRLFKSELL